ncbi:MAG: RluA family pseudouridine synthase [Lachnospiraceae bacterium]|nr:RluA family pseudouridine synthase [Lachnospiraceae bacterium]
MKDEAKARELSFTVPEELSGLRLDKGIAEYYEEISRSRIAGLIKDGGVSVNGKTAKASYSLEEGDSIYFALPESEIPDIEPEDIPLDILYEDEGLLVVNKPKGMVVHPANGHYTGTLVNALMYHCKDLSGINGVLRPGIVHRIDKDTSGSVIVCKNDLTHRDVAEQLKVHSIDRKYRAVVWGRFNNDDGTVDIPIARDKKDRKKMKADPSGKRAVTHYRVLEAYKEFSYVECSLETGRTHQIRVHMTHIGHPILGDEVYGSRKAKIHAKGQTLHAYFIGLLSPLTGERIEVTAPIPEYFETILQKLRSMG